MKSEAITPVSALDDINVLRQKATVDLPAVVAALVVKPFDEDSKATANAILKGIKVVFGRIDALTDPAIEAAKNSLAASKAVKAELRGPAERADSDVRAKLRAALSAEEAERQRLIREQQEAEAKAKKEADERKAKEEAALAEAAAKESSGQVEDANKLFDLAFKSATEPPPSAVPFVFVPKKSEGAVTRWKARVIDPALVPRQFLIVDQVALNKYATERKAEAVGTVAGVEFYTEIGVRI